MNGPGDIQGSYGAFSTLAPTKNNIPDQGNSFRDTFTDLIKNVDSQLKESSQMTEDFALGKNNNIHEVMISSEKAGLSLNFLLQIRNKFLEAYQEIMRMNF